VIHPPSSFTPLMIFLINSILEPAWHHVFREVLEAIWNFCANITLHQHVGHVKLQQTGRLWFSGWSSIPRKLSNLHGRIMCTTRCKTATLVLHLLSVIDACRCIRGGEPIQRHSEAVGENHEAILSPKPRPRRRLPRTPTACIK